MKKTVVAIVVCLLAATGLALAESATEREVKQAILESYEHLNQHRQDQADSYSKHGAFEFWSSGGMMHEIAPGGRPEKYEMIRLQPVHIHVIPLVEGQAAVAMFYSEGMIHPQGYAMVPNYRTRATQVFVKEDGKWKVRASHWSPLVGGAGTSQTATE